jgi:hypothetical protein
MVRVYEHRKSGETFLVVDPKLSLNEIEPVQLQVITLLGGASPEKGATKAEAPAVDEAGIEQAASVGEQDDSNDQVEG